MGYSGKLDLKFKARALRKRGLSIKTIEKRLNVSRSSVSIWVRDVILTKDQINKLYLNKKTGALKGSYVAAMNKIRRREELTKNIKERAKREIGKILKRDRFITGIAMYFAEGGKSDGGIDFSNSDPKAIKFMIGWFKEFCKVPNKKFRGALYIHDNLNEKKAINFWSKLTDIPKSQFIKTYIVKNNPKRLRKTKHEYGVFRIAISNVNLHRRIMGWIEGLLD